MDTVLRDFESEFRRIERDMSRIFESMFRTNVPRSISPLSGFPKIILDTVRESNFDTIVQNNDGTRKFQLHVHAAHIKPEDIQIKVIDKEIEIRCHKHIKGDNFEESTEYAQRYSLPSDLKPEELKSTMGEDGILTIEAPLPPAEKPKEHTIKIEHVKSAEAKEKV